jgi:hypothetical protein
LSTVCATTNSLSAQLGDFDSPVAAERAAAEAALSKEELHALCRQRLDKDASPAALIRALTVLGPERKPEDLPRILKYIGELDPSIALAAMDALRAFGTQALGALRELDDRQVDRVTRRQAVERLLEDHIVACCRRDQAINPFRLDFEGRFAELYSVDEDVDELMLKLLRESRGDIRDDISGWRNYYWYGYYTPTRPFIEHGGLAVAALARSRAKELLTEFGDLASLEQDQNSYYYGWYQPRTPVTMELAIFFARQGKPALADRLIGEMEGSMRWGWMDRAGGVHVQIAALQVTALGEYTAALERINENMRNLDTDSATASQAHYLRARILIHLSEEGAALRALEDSMEAGDSVMVMALVDDAFKPLADDRRFQAILRYCELAARRLDQSLRPWRRDPAEK